MTNHETHLSAQQEKTPKDVRLPQADENCKRTCRNQPPSQSGKKETISLNSSFPKSLRVRTNNHYQSIIKNGFRLYGTAVVFDVRKGRSVCPRLGITVSKRYGKAHDRNRFKRFVREAFRLSLASMPVDVEINVSPRYPVVNLPTLQIMLSEFASVPRLIDTCYATKSKH